MEDLIRKGDGKLYKEFISPVMNTYRDTNTAKFAICDFVDLLRDQGYAIVKRDEL